MQVHWQGGVTSIGAHQAYSGRGVAVSIRGYLANVAPAFRLDYINILNNWILLSAIRSWGLAFWKCDVIFDCDTVNSLLTITDKVHGVEIWIVISTWCFLTCAGSLGEYQVLNLEHQNCNSTAVRKTATRRLLLPTFAPCTFETYNFLLEIESLISVHARLNPPTNHLCINLLNKDVVTFDP